MTLDAILEQVAAWRPIHVCVTGGEPLAQPNCIALLQRLCATRVCRFAGNQWCAGYLDGGCAREPGRRPENAGLRRGGRNRYENIQYLTPNDQLKFVICSREDYDWAVSKLIEYGLHERVGEVLFSPSFQQLDARQLAEWIIADNLPVRFQLQLHKLLWNDDQATEGFAHG
jgi:7-carboxy-7-deazaguanine synthase